MNHPAEALLGSFHGSLLSYTKTLASRVRALVGPEKLSVPQHKELEVIIRTEFESFVWCVLGGFDNVGCSLPPGVLGYKIIAKPSAERENDRIIPLQEVDIREAELGYSDMWHEYLAERKQSAAKPGNPPASEGA